MKVTVERAALLEMLGKLMLVVKQRHTLPICETVHLAGSDGGLKGTATDLERFLLTSTRAKVLKKGAICVRPQSLAVLLKAVDADKVTITAKGATVRVEAGRMSLSLESSPAEDFPPVPEVSGVEVVVPKLIEALGDVDYAVARDDARPVLSGVCFTPLESTLELAGADGFRLAITATLMRGSFEKAAIVPLETVRLLRKLTGAVGMTIPTSRDKVLFKVGNITLISTLIQGSFPNYAQLVPKGGTMLKVTSAEVQKALKVIRGMKPASGIVRLQTKGKELCLWARTGDDGEGSIEVKVPASGKVKIAFNLEYLSDLVSRAGDTLTLQTTTPSSPGKVRVGTTTHVIMPMVVQWDKPKPAGATPTPPTEAVPTPESVPVPA